MCGLVALIAKKNANSLQWKHRDMFTDMLFMDQLRGEDATGIYGVFENGNAAFYKEASTVENFLADKGVTQFMYKLGWNLRAMVGHNRKATKGRKIDENSHPFHVGNTLLVHNGTLTNHHSLKAGVEVDSHALTHAVEEKGVQQALSEAEGAFAIMAYQADKKELHIIRNKERPLFWCETDEFWAFASEPWMLAGSTYRNGISVKEIVPLKENTLLTFDFSNEKKTVLDVKEIKFPEKKSFPFRTTKTTTKISSHVTNLGTPGLNYWKTNDVVCFTPTKLRNKYGELRLEGKHFLFPSVAIEVLFPKGTSVQEAMCFNNAKELSGILKTQHYDTANASKHTLVLDEISFSTKLSTINGKLVNDEILERVRKCNRCDSDVEEYEEIEAGYLFSVQNGKYRFVCSTCAEKLKAHNPNWGNHQ